MEEKIVKHLTTFASAFIIISLMFVSISYAEINPKTCVGMWLFDEGKGNIAKDSSGNGNDGTFNGVPKWVDGKFGNAVEFASSSDSIVVPDVASLNFGKDSFSIVTWFNFKTAQDWNRLVRERNPSPWGSGNYGWEIQTHGIGIYLSLDDKAGNNHQIFYDNVGDGDWHHTAMVINRDKHLLITYMDGVNEQTIDISDIGSVTGNLPVTFGGGFTGSLDEVGAFNVILSEDDIQTLMNQGLEKSLSATPVAPLDKLTTTWGRIKNYK